MRIPIFGHYLEILFKSKGPDPGHDEQAELQATPPILDQDWQKLLLSARFIHNFKVFLQTDCGLTQEGVSIFSKLWPALYLEKVSGFDVTTSTIATILDTNKHRPKAQKNLLLEGFGIDGNIIYYPAGRLSHDSVRGSFEKIIGKLKEYMLPFKSEVEAMRLKELVSPDQAAHPRPHSKTL